MNLKEWVQAQGVHPQTAYRWFREGSLPVPAQRVGPRTTLVKSGIASGTRAKARRLPADPNMTTGVVEHKDRLAA